MVLTFLFAINKHNRAMIIITPQDSSNTICIIHSWSFLSFSTSKILPSLKKSPVYLVELKIKFTYTHSWNNVVIIYITLNDYKCIIMKLIFDQYFKKITQELGCLIYSVYNKSNQPFFFFVWLLRHIQVINSPFFF